MKGLQHRHIIYYVGLVRETYSHCNIITDNTLPMLFPMEHLRSKAPRFAACVASLGLCRAYIGIHDLQRRPYSISKGCSLCNTATIASEKPTQGCQGIMSTLVTSGDLVRPLSNNDAT